VIENTVNNAGGNITANGGSVPLEATIQGGTLNTVSGGLERVAIFDPDQVPVPIVVSESLTETYV